MPHFKMFIVIFLSLSSWLHGRQSDDSICWLQNVDPKIIYIHPAENETVYCKDILLRWQPTLCTQRYHIQISDSKSFNKIILDSVISDSEIRIAKLNNFSEIFWRVRALGDHGNDANFDTFTFFKTSNIVVSNQSPSKNILVIPTSIDGQEILFIDNPDNLSYQIRIYDAERHIKFKHIVRAQKYGLATRFWARGKYEVDINVDDGQLWTNLITLY